MIAPATEAGICIAIGKVHSPFHAPLCLSSCSLLILTRSLSHSIDRGGTFTDCIATVPGQDDIVIKLLSVNPGAYADAPVEAIRRVLEKATGRSYPRGSRISLDGVSKS